MKRKLLLLFFIASVFTTFAQDKEKEKEDKKLSFKLSGYVNLNAIFDFNGLNDYDDFTTSEIPINPSPYEKADHFHMTAKQSRLKLDINYNTPWGVLHGFVSGDFTGPGGMVHMRKAYFEIGNILLGQTSTTFGNPNVVPATIDFEGPNSSTTMRNPMLRYSNNFKFGKGFSYILALEMRGTDRKPLTINGKIIEKAFKTIPTLVGTINKEGNWGVVSLSGSISDVRFFNTDSVICHDIAYGGAFSAIINTNKKNHFNVFLIAGKGISNFINDLSGRGYNGVPDLATNKLVLLNSYGGFISYTQNWSKKLSSNVILSYIQLEKTPLLADEDFRYSKYALANLFYAPFDRLVFGAEFVWGELFVQDNQNGDANRLQFLAKFSF